MPESAASAVNRLAPRIGGDLLRGNRVVFLGDSLTQGDQDNANGSPGSTLWPNIAVYESGGRLRYVRNAGVAGQDSDGILARFDADVVAYGANICVGLFGTNDFNKSPVPDTKANAKLFVAKCRANKIEPILCTVVPNSGAGVDKTNHDLYNLWLREYCARTGIRCADMALLTTDGTNGNWISTMVALGQDPTHPIIGGPGHLAMAAAVLAAIADLPARPPNLGVYKGEHGNLIPAPVFTGDANSDGIADGWSLGGNQAAFAGALIADAAIAGNWQQITRSGGSGVFILQSANITTGYAAGDRVQFSGRFSFAKSDTTSSISTKITFNGINKSFTPMTSYTKPTTNGIFCWDWVVPVGTTSISVQLFTSAGLNVCSFAQLALLNLTTMGIA